MDTKTFEVNLKALKSTPSMDIELAVFREGKSIAKRNKISEVDFDSIILTNEKHRLYDIYGSAISQPSWTKVPDKLRVKLGTTNLQGVFNGCRYLEEVDASGFDTSSVTTMKLMFSFGSRAVNTPHIKGLENLDTTNVTDMSHMFQSGNFTEIDLHTWNALKVTTMCEMFRSCEKLEFVDISGIDTSKVTNFDQIFYACDNLREVRGIFDLSSSYGTLKTLYFSDNNELPKLEKPIQLKNVPRELSAYTKDDIFEILSYKEN